MGTNLPSFVQFKQKGENGPIIGHYDCHLAVKVKKGSTESPSWVDVKSGHFSRQAAAFVKKRFIFA